MGFIIIFCIIGIIVGMIVDMMTDIHHHYFVLCGLFGCCGFFIGMVAWICFGHIIYNNYATETITTEYIYSVQDQYMIINNETENEYGDNSSVRYWVSNNTNITMKEITVPTVYVEETNDTPYVEHHTWAVDGFLEWFSCDGLNHSDPHKDYVVFYLPQN